MARPLRVDVAGGWYHVTARGIERRAIFESARDHEHFVELLEDLSERYALEVHAYVLMGNHYHLLVRSPQANTSAAMQWLNVSYSAWFNRKRQRVGHVFQGRFTSVLIDGQGSWALNASIYVHLNPVRTRAQGLGKSSNRAEAQGLQKPAHDDLRRRLKKLRAYRWSSFPAYAGYTSAPAWLKTDELLERAGGAKKYRRYVQQHVTRGAAPEGFDDMRGRLALGAVAFTKQVRGWVGRISPEQPSGRQLARRPTFARIVEVVERQRGERWDAFASRYADWGRDLVLYLARRRSGLTLSQIGDAAGGLNYKTVSKAAERFARSLERNPDKASMVKACLDRLSNDET